MKKRIVISILTGLLLSASVPIHANAILGDVNRDSVLNFDDAYAILEHCASIGAGNGGILSDKALMSADYSVDGKIDAKDAFKILVYCSKSEQLVAKKSEELATILDELATIDKWKDEWKKAYSIQLTKFQSYENRYELADINGDSIPELFIMLYEDTFKTMVYTYQNGSCQQIHFPTESGAIDTWNMYVSSEFDGLLVWDSLTPITDTGNYFYDNVITIYKIDNFTAISQHKLITDYANDSYYFDDTSITREEYYNYYESLYCLDQFYYITNRDLLNIYGTGESQANIIKNSINFDNNGCLLFDVTCNNITEKSNITFHVVPHGSEHILENAIEHTATNDISSLYQAIHNDCHAYYILGEIPAGDYDLFMLTDDGTELDSITFEVK
ncbi:MAG: hypothetical protein K2G88_01820 [Oscillospiraceae bacterium]|nr:hypothetical protein [Oscillospiraceae bacterium]